MASSPPSSSSNPHPHHPHPHPPTTASSFLRPAARSRASSTSVRPPLSLSSLAPRARAGSVSGPSSDSGAPSSSSSSQPSSAPSTPVDTLEPIELPSNRTMFPVLVARFFQLARSLRPRPPQKHATVLTSPIDSPRSSSDTDYILPLSASPSKASFDDIPVLRTSSVHAPLLIVLILFPLTTTVTLFSLSTLPITAAWPRTLSDLAQLGRDLNLYALSGFAPTLHVLSVLAVSAVWKHAWSIPGSVLWNVLAGALFHPLLATLVMTALTTIGSLFATLLAAPLAPLLTRFIPKPIQVTRSILEGSNSTSESIDETKYPVSTAPSTGATPAWVRLSVLRLIGIVPWSGLNIACGLTGVSLRDCAAGAFIGTLPWTAVTCQIGDILHTVGVVGSSSDEAILANGVSKTATLSTVLASPQIITELVFLSVLSLAPILARGQLQRWISPPKDDSSIEMELTEEDKSLDDDSAEKRTRRRTHRKRWSRISMSLSNFFEKSSDAAR